MDTVTVFVFRISGMYARVTEKHEFDDADRAVAWARRRYTADLTVEGVGAYTAQGELIDGFGMIVGHVEDIADA